MIANRVMEYLMGEGSDVDPAQLQVAMEACRHSMDRNLGIRREDGSRKPRPPRPSGTWACARQMTFNALGLETEGYGWRSRLTFTHGDMTEAMGVLVFRQALAARGESDLILSPALDGTQDELDVMIDPADYGVDGQPFRMVGHIDMSIRGHDDQEEPVDWKSASDWSFRDMQAAASDPGHRWWVKEEGGYIAQVRWYMIMLRALGRSTGQRGYLAVVNKNTGHLCEVLIQADTAAETLLVRKAVYVLDKIEAAQERQAIVLEDRGSFGDEHTDRILSEWTRENVPRAGFTEGMVIERSRAVARPDGSKGPCRELNTGGKDADPQAFRCSYCDHTARCWPGFSVVPLGKPVWRTNTE